MSDRLGVVIVSGGISSRFGPADKQTAELRGLPVFAHSLSVFHDSPLVDSIVVVFSPGNIEQGRAFIDNREFPKVVAVVEGGDRRQDSVRNGLETLLEAGGFDYVAVHDGARPFVSESILERGLAAARESDAAVAAVPSKDTIKLVDDDRRVIDTPKRDGLWSVQTPQLFRADLLKRAHQEITEDVTDDASMVERLGEIVTVFEGDYANIKITTPEDLRVAEALYDLRTGQPAADQSAQRWGIGFDGHKLTGGGPLRLGGIDVPFEMSLAGHSDGDVLLHAIASALLGAAGLGDLGSHFPSSDPKWKGVDSAQFVTAVLAMYEPLGWEVDHLDATIIAQRPRLSDHVAAMRDKIAGILGIPVDNVNIKVTSTDHVGAIGAGEGIAAQAVATIRRS